METFTHTCIKPGCEASYQDTDPDPYYCKVHLEEKNAVAAEVDAKVGARPKRPVVSDLQLYDQSQKVHGFMPVKL